MDILKIELDGQLIVVSHPIDGIKVNKKVVTYRDDNGSREVEFSTSSLARKFVILMLENR
jgi:hypothetical protein